MVRLPLEIWREIFCYACSDGGYTGTSVALACKLFYNASLPVRFYSLSLFSLRQVELFLNFAKSYEERYDGRRLKVHHLLLSFPASPSNCRPELSSEGSSGESSDPAEQWITARRLREHDKAAWDRRFLKLVPALLELAAPHLRSLALLQSDGFALPAIRHALSRLRELTLLVGISVMLNSDEAFDVDGGSGAPSPSPPWTPGSSPAPETPASATPSSPPRRARFPALERLHVVCGRHRDFVLGDTLAHLPRLAPALTHLRISNATYTHEHCLPVFLRDALGLAHPHPGFDSPATGAGPAWLAQADDADECQARLRELRRVLVHSVPPPSSGTYEGPYKDYLALVGAVDAIGAACDATCDVSVQTMRNGRAKQRHWEQVVEAEWMDRIEGGPGCWVGCEGDEEAAARV
ncbi:hypothetical protein TRAPUB_10393 [Trametes pubescens]|uniref:Uncharacterized protein n=1 Tax=Trametes pubescens TaxID=154538 RepID=A0A1M2VZT5_TRAPU|nr:hypothetical protein TRAPUB_10393 [Trametes pubescens]